MAPGEARSGQVAFAFFLLVATTIAYIPALGSGFIWDDDFYVTDNETLLGPAGLGRIWLDTGANPQYYPLTFTTFWLERRIFGLAPAGYHLVNVLLHAGSAFLLFRVLKLLEIPGAAFAAALFALHPLEVESVAWVTERKNVLSGIFFFSSALSYLRFSLGHGKARRFPITACAFFACALLSKSVTAVLPVALFLVLVWKKGRLGRRDLVPLGAMLLLGAAAGLLTAHLERQQVGAEGDDFAMTLVERGLLAGRIFWFYLGKLLLPVRLAFLYPRWSVDARAVGWVFPLAAIAFVSALFALRSRIGAGPFVAIAYYGIAIFPVLGFLSVFPMRYSWVADHFQYLAGVGPLALIAALATWAAGKIGVPRRLKRAAACVVLAAAGAASWQRAAAFHDAETLWRDTVSEYPDTWMAQYNLACLLDAQGKTEEAVGHLQQALQTNPGYLDALNNLGAIRLDQGKVEEAAAHFGRILAVAPTHVTARYNLAAALDRAGKTDRAIAELEEVMRYTPTSMSNQMTALLYRRGWVGIPLEQTHAALAGLLARRGRTDEAIAHYGKAAELRPDIPEPWLSLGRLYQDRGDLARAVSCFERAVAIDGANPTAHFLLGRACELAGLRERALAEYRAALRLAPDFAEARERLGSL